MDRPLLIDVSGWQTYPNTGHGTNFVKAKSNGAVGAMIRAGSCRQSDGLLYEDYDLKPNVQLSNEMVDEFPRWFYWYMRAQWGGVRQAEYFLKLIDDAGAGDAFVGLVGDFEGAGTHGLTPPQAASEWDQFMEVIRYHFPNKKHMIYGRALFLNNYSKYMSWASYYDYWVPIYPTFPSLYTHPWQNPKYRPHIWDNWTFWQWTDKGKGADYGTESKQVDLNYFNGTLEEFYKYTDISIDNDKPPQPEIPSETPTVVIQKPVGVNIEIIEV